VSAPVTPFDIHTGYAALMLLGLSLTLFFPVTSHFANATDKRRYYKMQVITIVGAVIGAKIAVVIGDALWPLQPFNDWYALLGSGRSIVGALLFGFLFVEIAKPLMNYDIPPNDKFAMMLPFSIAIGRIGCMLAGCCQGTPHEGLLSMADHEGIHRHPTQLYDALFQVAIGTALVMLWLKRILFGRLFALYLVTYGTFRFGIEYIRDTNKAFAGFSGYQLLCVAMIAAGLVTIWVRSVWQPPSWQLWRTRSSANG
jgi:phosphatidylglycerol---prolipoprotein diacylglyceryl transferase